MKGKCVGKQSTNNNMPGEQTNKLNEMQHKLSRRKSERTLAKNASFRCSFRCCTLLHAAERLVLLRSEAEGDKRDVGHSEESEAGDG